MRTRSDGTYFMHQHDKDALSPTPKDDKHREACEFSMRCLAAFYMGQCDALAGFDSSRFNDPPQPETEVESWWHYLQADYLKGYATSEAEHRTIVSFARSQQ